MQCDFKSKMIYERHRRLRICYQLELLLGAVNQIRFGRNAVILVDLIDVNGSIHTARKMIRSCIESAIRFATDS